MVLINSLVHSIAPLAHERNLELNCFISKDFPHHVFGDAQRLRQILSNLIRHAIEHCTINGIYLRADAGDTDTDDQNDIQLSISYFHDTDSQRLDASALPSSDDTLALRVGSQLTRLMGGSFDIKYTADHTPEFILNFRWKLDKLKAIQTPKPYTDRRVLIFEPDEVHREILCKYCEQLGVESYATDGKDNLVAHILWSQKKNKLFDAIILCENLKQNNSQDLVKRIRYETNCQAPVLYATYIQSIELTKLGVMQDVQQTTTKPISLEQLNIELGDLFETDSTQIKAPGDNKIQKNILLAEDSEINASIVYSHLADMGHNVDVATDGTTALYAMHKHHYHIVFMDLNMPNTDGIEATRQWRKLEPEQSHLPIVALTAKATSEDRKKCLEAGMDGFLTKPVTATQLAETLESFQ